MAKREQPVVMSLLDFFIECVEDEKIRNRVVSHLTTRCASLIQKGQNTRGLTLVASILYQFLGRRGNNDVEELFDTNKLILRVSKLTTHLIESSSSNTAGKDEDEVLQDANILQNYLALISRLLVVINANSNNNNNSDYYYEVTLELIGVGVKSFSVLSCALLRWLSGTRYGRILLSCPKSVNQVMSLTLNSLKRMKGTRNYLQEEEMCKALWYA